MKLKYKEGMFLTLLIFCVGFVSAVDNLAFDKYVVSGSDGISFNYVIPNQTCTVVKNSTGFDFKSLFKNFNLNKTVPPNAPNIITHWYQLNPLYLANEFNLWVGNQLPNMNIDSHLPNITLPNITLPDLSNDNVSLNTNFWNGVGEYNTLGDEVKFVEKEKVDEEKNKNDTTKHFDVSLTFWNGVGEHTSAIPPIEDYKKDKERIIHYDVIENNHTTHKVVNLTENVEDYNTNKIGQGRLSHPRLAETKFQEIMCIK